MIQYGNDAYCDCGHWWADHNSDDTCSLCGCDRFQEAERNEE